jgi:hypothetical protein
MLLDAPSAWPDLGDKMLCFCKNPHCLPDQPGIPDDAQKSKLFIPEDHSQLELTRPAHSSGKDTTQHVRIGTLT